MAVVQPELDKDMVAAYLRLGVYVPRWPSSPTDTSKTYNVLQKIYRADTGVEVYAFYRCSWCANILKAPAKFGTSPLVRHVDYCTHRPDGYVFPETNLNRRPRQRNVANVGVAAPVVNAAVVAPASIANVPPNNVVPAAIANRPNVNTITSTRQLAITMAAISEIGLLYGNITASEMMSILPSADGHW